jgi:hypothetical protein
MRPALLALTLLGLGGCSFLDRPAGNAPPPGAPPPGQWQPQQPYYNQAPPQQQPQQPWAPPAQPAPWTAPQPQPAPQPAPGTQSFPWPVNWQPPPLPAPIAWPSGPAVPGGWPGVPGLPTWPGQAQPQPQPPPGQPVQPQPAPSHDVAQRCVDNINGYRATKGLPALARWVEAEPCATDEAAEDSRTQRAHGSFGRCKEGSQNACPNWPGPPERMIDECLKMMWAEGPGEFPAHGHYMNMVDTRSTKVACGTYTMPNGSLWAVQDFR